MISIITATYNAAATLRHCIDSVQAQKGTGMGAGSKGACPRGVVEHLLIDGGSTDGTLEVIRDYGERGQASGGASPRTRTVSEPDNGLYDAMNKGLRMAGGDIIGILNADDFYADERVLERVAEVFEDPEVEACYGDLVYVKVSKEAQGSRFKVQGSNQSPFTSHQLQVLRYWKSGSFTPEKMRWGWMPPHPTFFVRRGVYEKYGLFNLDLGSAADYELMLRFLLRHRIKVAYIPEVLVCMRAGGVSNASIKNRLAANRMDRKAWEVNGLRPYPWTIPLKPLRKIPQYFLKPGKPAIGDW